MIRDVHTMIWKEWKEFLVQGGRSRKGRLFTVGIPIAIFGIFIPWRAGPEYVNNLGSLIVPALMPLLFTMAIVSDSFAGERERHTLETLLASRLSDEAILFGKLAAAVLFAGGMFVFMMTLGLIGVNLAHSDGRLLLFPLNRVIAVLVLDFLLAAFVSAGGVLVSLRAATVRQAMQTLNMGFMVMMFGSLFGFESLPATWRATLLRRLSGENSGQTLFVAALILVLLDVALLTSVHTRFRRARLILD
jgi:ABC-2 type transport system permease protein